MKAFVLLLLFALAGPPAMAAPRRVLVSDWVTFTEAQARLVLEEPLPGEMVARGGIEIRLATGFKTYWRNPGDSGVPPVFAFADAGGLSNIAVAFPFPDRFDDGAGGTAWGYKTDVILPFEGAITVPAANIWINLTMDFAVCGTLCIPLSGEMRLEVARATPGSEADAAALRAARDAVPAIVDPARAAAMVAAQRLPGETSSFLLSIAWQGDPGRFVLFAEARGYLDIRPPALRPDGRLAVRLDGQPAPGSGGRFGPTQLTFGSKQSAFALTIDLDGAPAAP